jgi:hypothetical protein
MTSTFYLRKGNVFGIPVLHHCMEFSELVFKTACALSPQCVAVELPEPHNEIFLKAAERLPAISVATRYLKRGEALHYLSEPCDASFEALRWGLEHQATAFCIDLEVDGYPEERDPFPDPYAAFKIGFKSYYEHVNPLRLPKNKWDLIREEHMARRLKELSLQYDSVLFVGGMAHVESVLHLLEKSKFEVFSPSYRSPMSIVSPHEDCIGAILGEWPSMSKAYEKARDHWSASQDLAPALDRQKLLYKLYKEAGQSYEEKHGAGLRAYQLRNILKFARNYALLNRRLLPDLFQAIIAAKSCVDAAYAFEVWKLATAYPFHHNLDHMEEKSFKPEEIWGASKRIYFPLKASSPKRFSFLPSEKKRGGVKLYPPSFFSICSYPPEDEVIEKFGRYLKKKGKQTVLEERARTIPFSTSLEDGIDLRETIRHWPERKLFVKSYGQPPGDAGALVVIFEDEEKGAETEKYPWCTTWLGEHEQESDMGLYATHLKENVVGPGISRCRYGGFMMSYPPRRLLDVWRDPDYVDLKKKSEVLLAASIDYSLSTLIVYVAAYPPRDLLKSYARRRGRKIAYVPIGQLAPATLQKLRNFHVLDGHHTRGIAGEYIDSPF